MKLKSVEIENYRAIEKLVLSLNPSLTVLHGDNAHGKTSVLNAIAVGLGVIPKLLPDVSGINFLKRDRRKNAPFVQVELTLADGITWSRRMVWHSRESGLSQRYRKLGLLQRKLDEIVRADREGQQVELPVIAFYDTDRAILDRPAQWLDVAVDASRYSALDGALSTRKTFRGLFHWFSAKEYQELKEQRKRNDFSYRRKDLSAVRKAISCMLNGITDPRIELNPPRLLLRVKLEEGGSETLEIDQLSGGQRAVLALAGDLASRMAQANPHLDDPLTSEAIVLIDEVELHLHPSWQQRILTDLRRTFPNTQFIVSTHSPQVLTTVEPEHVVELAREDGRIVAGSAGGWTYGAEAGDVLSVVMGVDERPVNDFTEKLARYRRLISDDQGESQEALALRQELQKRSPDDPALGRADLEIRRRKLFREMGESM